MSLPHGCDGRPSRAIDRNTPHWRFLQRNRHHQPIAAIFVPLLYNRGFYSPVALVNLKAQVRNILGLWTIPFLAFACVAFALKVGSDLGMVLLFGVVGLMAILLHHALWRTITEPALEVGAL